ncbi:ribbon-helix-helix domain-containing protein [Methylobacterium sp. SI9]|uniref:ribbon-helix-helix domain-containing protein n=1 Tax=Methylobacterium guangdongense TaxID=3138811 RepID=UPI00313C09C4
MPVKHARHIALSAPLAAWIDELVARGEYTSASDLVRTALRQMRERDGGTAVEPVGRRARREPSTDRA